MRRLRQLNLAQIADDHIAVGNIRDVSVIESVIKSYISVRGTPNKTVGVGVMGITNSLGTHGVW